MVGMIRSDLVVPGATAAVGKSASIREPGEVFLYNSHIALASRSHALWNFLCKPSEMVKATELQDEAGRVTGVNRYSGPRLISFGCGQGVAYWLS